MSTREKSSQQEKLIEKHLSHLGAQRTPNSGAGFKKKGDLQDDLSLFEAKTMMTKQKQYTIKEQDLETLEFDRRRDMKQFAFLLYDFGETTFRNTYVTMRFSDFIELYETYKEHHELI